MKNESIEETIEKYGRLRTREKELKKEISKLEEKIEELWDRAPRLRDAGDGVYYPGTVAYKEPGEEKVRYVFTDASMTENERAVKKLLDQVFDQKKEEETELTRVHKELTLIESKCINAGIPLAVLEKGQPALALPLKRGPKPKKTVAKRSRIVLEETGATTKRELGRLLRKPLIQKRIFHRLDKKRIPLPNDGRGYEAESWMDLFDTREHNKAADVVRRYIEKNWD